MTTEYTLKYFNARGNGENARMALVLGLGCGNFIDKRYDSEEWKKNKDSKWMSAYLLLHI